MKNDADKQKCISEVKRVCKDGGKIFFAFISNDFVFLTEFGYDANYFSNGDYDKETFKLNDFPFVFHTVGAARKLLADGGINIIHEVASDGASELLAARINEMSDEDYKLGLLARAADAPRCASGVDGCALRWLHGVAAHRIGGQPGLLFHHHFVQ